MTIDELWQSSPPDGRYGPWNARKQELCAELAGLPAEQVDELHAAVRDMLLRGTHVDVISAAARAYTRWCLARGHHDALASAVKSMTYPAPVLACLAQSARCDLWPVLKVLVVSPGSSFSSSTAW